MELSLTRPPDSAHVAVQCDGNPSHTFDLTRLIPAEGVTGRPPPPLEDPARYGEAVFAALFPPDSPARRALDAGPERLLLVLADSDLHTIPWEYAHGPRGFLVLDFHFARGLPPGQRNAPPALNGALHIVAVPSHPLGRDIAPLNIDGEWQRLKAAIEAVPAPITLERVRPPTLEKLRDLLAGQTHRVAHFMGHGGQHDGQAVLLFEKENGAVDFVTAQDFVRRVKKAVFLVTLNACVSAAPGPTEFSNLAAALVQQGVPYALGMRFSIVDDDARALSRTLYSELARGSSVEEAVRQARQTLARSPRAWAVGVPVLCTSLSAPAPGFPRAEGTPRVDEHQPPLEVSALSRAEGAFQGRVEELKAIGEALTGDARPRLLTLHGGGGVGKTALARETVERFAFAWPGGAWAISLENLPDRNMFVTRLAEFLKVQAEPHKLAAEVLAQLQTRRLLIALDNAETLVEAVRAEDESARALAQFIREQLSGPTVSLLATSREHLGWPGETAIELGGLSPAEGAELFTQSAPQRMEALDRNLAEDLSRAVAGHPLSLRLLGGAFNGTAEPLAEFVKQAEERLLKAEDIYKDEDHRQRTLYASIETSARYLPEDLRDLLSGLWIFHAPFLPQTAAAIFASPPQPPSPEEEALRERGEPAAKPHAPRGEAVPDQLRALWGRGLLTVDARRLHDGDVLLYHILPTIRPYAERYLPQAHDRDELLARFAAAYARLADLIERGLNQSAALVYVAQQARADLERGHDCAEGEARARYGLDLSRILDRLGDRGRARQLAEQTLEWAEGQDRRLQLRAMNALAMVYRAIGQPTRARELYEQALPIMREVGDRAGEAATLNNLAMVYRAIGQPTRARELYEQALPLMREVGDRAGEAATLNGLAYLLVSMERYEEALTMFQQSIALEQQVQHFAGECAGLVGMAQLLYQYLRRPQEAVTHLEHAIAILQEMGLPQDAAGQTPQTLRELLDAMRRGVSLETGPGSSSALSPEQLNLVVANTVTVLTARKDKHAEWRAAMEGALGRAQQAGANAQNEAGFLAAVLALLDGHPPALPSAHPYAEALARIQAGITSGGSSATTIPEDVAQAVQAYLHAEDWAATRQVVEAQQAALFHPEAAALLQALVARAQAEGNQRAAEMLQLHLDLLRERQANGIGPTFEKVLAAQRAQPAPPEPSPGGLPPDFVAKCAAALAGPPELKEKTFDELQALAAAQPALRPLVRAVQNALFGTPLAELGGGLTGEQAAVWRQIVESVSR